jgi:HlyD family secretion protein
MFAFLWRLLSAHRRRQLGWLQLVSLLMAFSTLGGVAAIVPFFTLLADPGAIDRHALLAALYRAGGFADRDTFLGFLGAAFAAMVLLSNAVNLAGSAALNRFALGLGRDFHVALFEEYLHRDYPFHLRWDAATLANKVINETARVVTGMVQGGLNLVANLLACALIVGSILLMNPLLALATALLFMASYAAIYFALRQRLARRGQREAQAWHERTRTLNDGFGSIKEVLLHGMQARFRDAFAAHSDALTRVGLSIWTMSQAPRHLLECITAIGLAGAAFWLNRGTGAATWLAQLSFLAFAAYRLLPAIQQAFVAIARIRAQRAAFQQIADDPARGLAARRAPPPGAGQLAAWRGRPRRSIVLRDVSYRHSREAPPAIHGFSAEISRGQVVGIVGANGAGKTTLGDLILGLLRPDSGSIEIDGVALEECNLALWRHQVAYVPQHIFLLDASILDNITFGTPSHQVDPARVRAACRAACLEPLIASLPGGAGHRVGDRGTRLSGGQRQRLGIARALYRDASLLVLDEATSSLDGAAEHELVRTLEALRGDRTVLVIAHRPATLAACQCVLELEQGALVNQGSYEDVVVRRARAARRAGIA